MVIRADKRPPQNRTLVQRIQDFSGGLNTTISGSLLNPNEAQVANNLSLEQKGTIQPRKGRRRRYTLPFSTGRVTGLGAYYKNDGTSRLLITSNDSIFFDTPHMSTKWNSKADWEQANTLIEGFASLTEVEGSVVGRSQAFGQRALCNDGTLWTSSHLSLTLSAETVHQGGASLNGGILAGQVTGYAHAVPIPFDNTRFAVLVGYVRNINASLGIRLVGLTPQIQPSKTSNFIIGTTWTRIILKFNPSELASCASFGVQISGAATQSALFTALFFNYITQADFDNVNYVPPELTHFEAFQRREVFSDSTRFNLGTYTNALARNNRLELAIALPEQSFIQTSQSDFNLGVLNDVNTSEIIGSVVLARQP